MASTLRATLMCTRQRLWGSTSTSVLNVGAPHRSVRVLFLQVHQIDRTGGR